MEILGPHLVDRRIEDLIDNAVDRLTLVSAYFKPWPKLAERIVRKLSKEKTRVTIVVRADNTEAKENGCTFAALGAHVYSLDRLHAKLYINQDHAIVTSMNLFGGSRDSDEVGIRVDRTADEAAYAELCRIADEFVEKASRIEKTSPEPREAARPVERRPKASAEVATPTAKAPRETRTAKSSKQGSCLRCGDGIALNPDRPLCRTCFQEWARYENPDYEENYCHECGRTATTSVARPLCKTCWKASS